MLSLYNKNNKSKNNEAGFIKCVTFVQYHETPTVFTLYINDLSLAIEKQIGIVIEKLSANLKNLQ